MFSSIYQFFHNGGFFMIPLSMASFFGTTAIAYKLLTLRAKFIFPTSLATEILAQPQLDQSPQTLKRLLEGKSTLARLATVAWNARAESRERREIKILAAAKLEIHDLSKAMSLLDNITTVAPLLGLLGTASGLVEIFKGLGEAANHLAISHGIAEALHTTIFGLAIAVPCVVASSFFSRKIEALTSALESTLSDFSTHLSDD